VRCLLLPTGCTHETAACGNGVAQLLEPSSTGMPANNPDGQTQLRQQGNIRIFNSTW